MYTIVGADGRVYGPIDLATLHQWVLEGRVGQRTQVTDVQNGLTLAAGNIPGLAKLFRPDPMSQVGPYGSGVGQLPAPGAPMFTPAPADTGPLKSKAVGAVLAILLGTLGIHRFYLGDVVGGAALLAITLLSGGLCIPISLIWSIIDAIRILTGSIKDQYGRELA